jgi:hypothetical protein
VVAHAEVETPALGGPRSDSSGVGGCRPVVAGGRMDRGHTRPLGTYLRPPETPPPRVTFANTGATHYSSGSCSHRAAHLAFAR